MIHPAPLLPSCAAPRLAQLDLVRGVAVLGVLLLNIQSFAMPEEALSAPWAFNHSAADQAVWFTSEVFWRNKFYSLLALLFGAGIVLKSEKNGAPGNSPVAAHYRRMAFLFVTGLLHAFFVWYGDILAHYAICGSLAFLARRARVRWLLAMAVLLQLVSITLNVLPLLFDSVSGATLADPDAEIAAYTTGTWGDQLLMRSRQASVMLLAALAGAPGTISLMLLGMAMLRSGRFSAPADPVRAKRSALWLCAIGWVMGATAVVTIWITDFTGGDLYTGMSALFIVAALVTMSGYLAAGRAWAASTAFPVAKRVLQAVGRTSLSNYLAQSVIATWIFYGHGLGWFGSLDRLQQLGGVLAIWALQISGTLVWLRFFRQGPMEMIMRRLTGPGVRAA